MPAAADRNYSEEREFTLKLEARIAFPADYQGEGDGYAWAPDFERLCQRLVVQLVQTAQREGWQVQPANRGRSPHDEAVLVVSREP